MRTLILIDANAFIHRCFHALPPLIGPDKQPTGALYGLASILLKVTRELKPNFILAAFDRPEPTFRHQEFKAYKAHRPKAPDDLVSQIIEAHSLIQEFGIKILEKPGFEADDIIGTIAEKAKKEEDLQIIILSGDLDTLQLVEDERIVVLTPKKGVSDTVFYNEKDTKERFGIGPELLADYKGLVGDPSDNIPGVKGIGPKTAVRILEEFGPLEDFYEKIKKIDLKTLKEKEQKLFQKLLENEKQALFSKHLATIKRDVPLDFSLDKLHYQGPEIENLTSYFQKLGFESLVKRIEKNNQILSQSLWDKDRSENLYFLSDPEKTVKIDKNTILIGFDLKKFLKSQPLQQFKDQRIFDLGVAFWLIDPSLKDYSPQTITKKFLKKPFLDFSLLPELFYFAQNKLREYELEKIFYEIEMPLLKILAQMEIGGIKINTNALNSLSETLTKKLGTLTKEIFNLTQSSFNINSPKQLSQVIFDQLKIPSKGIRRTPQKLFSTDSQELGKIKAQHPVIEKILEYRELFKLKNTYLDVLPNIIDKNSRIRTTFVQTGTTTGRLSSKNPNLQNIPRAGELANDLRRAFISEPDCRLIAFDYSQIELRIIASLAKDQKMIKAFLNDKDIHLLTAAEVNNVSLDEVTPEMRQKAKALNFGIIYGMGAEAFSRSSGISKEEAKKFISEYFNDFPQIQRFQEELKNFARTFSYVKTELGRRRWLFDIVSFNPGKQAAAERAALNMPVQGGAADIIKLAMVKIVQELEKRNLWNNKIKILLQIHDELLFEVNRDIVKDAVNLIRNIMEQIYPSAVPLKVEVKVGDNWSDLQEYV